MGESASWQLQKSMVAVLRSDAALTSLLGGQRIYDQAPRRAAYPFVTIGHSIARDWSTSSDVGCEHLLSLHVWSKAGGKKQIYAIMNRVRQVLSGSELALSDHQLVNMRHVADDARLDRDGETHHGLMRFRAVTEQLA